MQQNLKVCWKIDIKNTDMAFDNGVQWNKAGTVLYRYDFIKILFIWLSSMCISLFMTDLCAEWGYSFETENKSLILTKLLGFNGTEWYIFQIEIHIELMKTH